MLKCPVCKKDLKRKDNKFICIKGHSFDVSKQGYTNLYLKASSKSGDNKEMVKARTHFLEKGFYQPLIDTLLIILNELEPVYLVDAGCGEGYYTKQIAQSIKGEVYAFDLSKEALKHASKQDHKSNYFLSSIFDMPLKSHCADVILNIFAPFAWKEFSRLVKRDGYIIKVDPNRNHLYELKQFLYDEVYENEMFQVENKNLKIEKTIEVEFKMSLNKDDLQALFKMTPYAYKTKQDKIEQLFMLDGMECSASFIIYLMKVK